LAQKTQTQNAVVAQARPFAELLRLPSFRLALVSMMAGQAVMVGLMVLMPLHAKHLGHDLPTITGLQTGHVVGMFGFAWLSGILADRFGRRALVVFGVVQLVISGVVAASAFTVVPMAVSLFLLGTGWNACYVAGSTLLADALQANERASVQGSADLLVWFSAALGALGGGWIVGQFGFSTAAWVACVLACVPLAVLVLTPQAGSRAG
jgi:MFS family permease